jgi:transglutaminase-like putative cysteine protease
LREASFDRYDNGEWKNTRRAFRLLQEQGERWRLRGGDGPQQMTVRRSIPGGEGLLALPVGAQVIDRLPARALEVLPIGSVRAKGTPRFVAFDIAYDERLADDAPAGREDLETPQLLASLLDQVIAREGLKGVSGEQTRRAVERYFASRFAYSLTMGDTKSGARGIAEFLLRDHKGHCEYFATATVLLLRRAGIPARYTVGYSAQEYSDRERAFLVRHRHGHAWARAFVDGRWITVDTTPARWAENEREAARSSLGPLMDWVSWLSDRVLQSWMSHSARQLALAAATGFALLVAPFAIRLLLRRLGGRSRTKAGPASPATLAWRSLEKRLAKRGLGPRPGETARAWAQRLHAESPSEPWRAKLLELAQAYYRVRFDPAATAHSEREFVDAIASAKPGSDPGFI